MTLPPRIGFHASHEQFAPSELVLLAHQAEAAGFDCGMSSDHFHAWNTAQGHSGFAWSWLGAAMASTQLPMGAISAPGYCHHPAILAQGAATLTEMFPDRFWLALGCGQRLNEDITGLAWPEKAERNARLSEYAWADGLRTVSADPGWHAARIAGLGFEEIQLHQVGRNQQAFIDTFGERVSPALRR